MSIDKGTRQDSDIKSITNDRDLIDSLLDDWRIERPELDVSGMAIVGRIINLASRLKGMASTALQQFELPYTEFDVLATLRRSGAPYELMPTELMGTVLITSGAMTATLRRLEDRGLVERAVDANDKRIKRVCLTAIGKDLIDRAAPVRFNEAQAAISGLSMEQEIQLADLLRAMGRQLSQD